MKIDQGQPIITLVNENVPYRIQGAFSAASIGLTHMAMLFQNADGQWNYFSVGAAEQNADMVGNGTQAKTTLQPMTKVTKTQEVEMPRITNAQHSSKTEIYLKMIAAMTCGIV